MVDVKPLQPVKTPVTLAAIKAEPKLAEFGLVRQGRLSVVPVSAEEWKFITKLAGIKA
jgi:predicted RNA-binding protein with PUA-like domain